MNAPSIYADFQNVDAQGRLRLNCVGTLKDLSQQRVMLRTGMVLTLYSDDVDEDGNPDNLQVSGMVEYSDVEQCWVARVDWDAIRHASELNLDGRQAMRSPVPVAQQ